MNPRKINPPHYFGLTLALMLGVNLVYPRGNLLDTYWNWIGLIPVLCGITVATLAARQFSVMGTSIIPLTRSTSLVTEGMFRYSRNPMYLSMIITLAGINILLANLWLTPLIVFFLLIIRYRFITYEELLMQETFGDEYLAYCTAVRRWL